jgi:hypothetical protein
VTREPGLGAPNVGAILKPALNLLKLLIFYTGRDLARRLLRELSTFGLHPRGFLLARSRVFLASASSLATSLEAS